MYATECETKRLQGGKSCDILAPACPTYAVLKKTTIHHRPRANSASRMLDKPRAAVACAFTEGGQHV